MNRKYIALMLSSQAKKKTEQDTSINQSTVSPFSNLMVASNKTEVKQNLFSNDIPNLTKTAQSKSVSQKISDILDKLFKG